LCEIKRFAQTILTINESIIKLATLGFKGL